MKRLLPILALLFFVSAAAQVQDAVPARPSPPKLVNITVNNFLTAEQIVALEHKLVAYDDSTSNQIAIVVVDDLKGYSASDFALALGRKWGVGNKNFDNGVVLLISTGGGDGNRDAFIAVGYGLEGVITDVTASTILQTELIPALKSGNYYRGLDETVDALIRAAEGRYKAPEGYGNRGRKKGMGLASVIIIAVILIILFSSNRGGGGGYASRRGYRGWWFPTGGWTGGGGGGGWSGGGGGGFGGFGGGGFGGGGAGGKW